MMHIFPLIICVFVYGNIGLAKQDFVDVSGFAEGCGVRSKSEPSLFRMHGGDLSKDRQFPWIVRLHGWAMILSASSSIVIASICFFFYFEAS